MFQPELSKLSGSGTSYTLSDYSYLQTFKSMYIRVDPSITQYLTSLNSGLLKHFKDFILSTLEPPYPQSFLYKEMISIFIVSPHYFQTFKAAMLQEDYQTHLHVIVFDEDTIQQKREYKWKATKLVTTDQNTIKAFIVELYQYCYYEFLIARVSGKFTTHNHIHTAIYYPHSFNIINKMLEKKDFSDYYITFHAYKKSTQHLVKEQVKKIKNQERRSLGSNTNKSHQDGRNRVIVIASQDSMEQFLGDRDYQLTVMRKQDQQDKFVKQFLDVYNNKVEEIDIVSCNTLYLIVPYFDEQLRSYVSTKYSSLSSLKLLQYSSLTSLKDQTLTITYPDIGLIFCDSSFQMISLLIKSFPNLKLILYNFHQKVKAQKIYQKLPTKQDAQHFIDKTVQNRTQYKDPGYGLSGHYIYLLLNENDQNLIQQISTIASNRNNFELGVFKETEDLVSLVENKPKDVKILVIIKRESVRQYIKVFAESVNCRLIVLSPGHVEYNSLLLDVFRKKSDFMRFLMSIIIKGMSSSSVDPPKVQKSAPYERYSVDYAIKRKQDIAEISEIVRQKSSPRISEIDSVISQIDHIQQSVQQEKKQTKNHTIVSKICQLTISTIQPKNQPIKSETSTLPIQSLDSINSANPQKKIYKKSQFTDQSDRISQLPLTQISSSSRFKQNYPSFSKSYSRSNLSITGYDHIHIYFQKNLPVEIMQFILQRCESSNRLIPHQLNNYLELIRNTRTYTSQFFISVLKNSMAHNQMSKVMNNNHKSFQINNSQQIEQFKQLIYQLSQSRVNNSKMIENKLSRIQCQRMITILNPQQRIDPSVFSTVEYSESQQEIQRQTMFTEEELQVRLEGLLKVYSSLKILIPSVCYGQFQSSVLHLQRFKFQIYSNEGELEKGMKSFNDPGIVLVTRKYNCDLSTERNVIVALEPYISETVAMYQISSILKLILLLNNQNNRPESSSTIYK